MHEYEMGKLKFFINSFTPHRALPPGVRGPCGLLRPLARARLGRLPAVLAVVCANDKAIS